MPYTTYVRGAAVSLAILFYAAHACAELVFDNTQFALKSASRSGSGALEKVMQTYEPHGDNVHQCVLFVYPRPKSTVSGIMNVDKAVMRPPVTIAPLEIINKPSQKYKDDATSIILIRNNEDNAKFKVILHRATLITEDLVREVQIECALKYAGFFGNGLSEFDKLKAAWLTDVFELEPELHQPQ
jgi:hypothetical protein